MDEIAEENNIPHVIGPSGVIIFDGSCGACTAVITKKKAFFEQYGFSTIPLQEPWVHNFTGLTEEELMKSIHLFTQDGRSFQRADFFMKVAERIWWARPLYFALRIPIINEMASLLYDKLAARRQQVSAFCGLEDRALYKESTMPDLCQFREGKR